MQHLSEAKVREIIRLAEENFNSLPQTQTQEEILEAILGEPSPQETALKHGLRALSREELLDLAALMYIGRDNVHGGQVDVAEVRSEFAALQRGFVHDDSDALADQCASKNLVLHRYLKHGLRAAAAADL